MILSNIFLLSKSRLIYFISPLILASRYSGITPLIAFNSVLFPHPECPVITVISPALHSKFRFLRYFHHQKINQAFLF